MSVPPQRTRGRRRGRPILRWAALAIVLALVFGIGVAVGQALEERPRAGDPVTRTSTIRPWTQTRTRP